MADGSLKVTKVADKVSRKSSGMGSKIGKAGKLAAVGFGAAAAGAAVLGAAGLKAIKVAEEQGTANATKERAVDFATAAGGFRICGASDHRQCDERGEGRIGEGLAHLSGS